MFINASTRSNNIALRYACLPSVLDLKTVCYPATFVPDYKAPTDNCVNKKYQERHRATMLKPRDPF